MTHGSKYIRATVWLILAGVILLITLLFVRGQMRRSDLPVISQTGDFILTNHLGQVIQAGDLRGRVWVADIIFTRCGGPCPAMTEEMSRLQKRFADEEELRFVTLTTDPAHDTPPVLKEYATRFDANPAQWWFLTGSTNQIRDLAIGGLKLTTVPKEEEMRESPVDLFIHSTIFVLVDRRGRVRGVYESLEPGFQEKISADIRGLLREP